MVKKGQHKQMPNAKVFRGGVPWEVDVARLREAFPAQSLTEGRVISHDELIQVLRFSPGPRYYSVLHSWFWELETNHNVYLNLEAKVGVRVLDPSSLRRAVMKNARSKAGQLVKASRRIDKVDRSRLPPAEQQVFDHESRVLGAIRGTIAAAQKQLAVEFTPVASLPKPTIPIRANSTEDAA
jgi:hypothetical protein